MHNWVMQDTVSLRHVGPGGLMCTQHVHVHYVCVNNAIWHVSVA